ncbi:MAG: DNA polymerase III subunit alpha, partial [Acidobacteriota bacterium]
QALQLLQGNFPRGTVSTLTPWDPQELWPLVSAAIAKRCHFAFDTDAKHYPVFKVPEGETLNSYLEKVVREGFKRRVEQGLFREAGKGREDEYTARLARELKIITQMDLAGYFLIVWDFIRHARENGVPVGPGRGSAAGSFVSYCMGITNIDPLNYGLLFERFLNPERVSMPDIDIDFCMRGRSKIIDYVTEEYGRNNVAQIITFGEMKARLAIRDVGRALGVPLAKVDKIAKAVPADPGMNITIEGALKLSPQLKKTYDSDAEAREVLDIAKRLEGMARHASTHAAGVVIAPSSIQEFLPLYKGAGREEITTQYSKDEIEALGLLKMDFLGLRTLTIIADTLALVREAGQEPPDLESIPLTDEATFALFGDGNTDGVFQFESGGMKDILRRLKPKRFEDLIVLNALYRPGPLDAGMIGEYIARAHGTKEAAVPISEVKPILDETLGVIVYQEQVMMIAHQLAGFTLGEADSLRKAMSKKDANAMQVLKKKFLEGCRKRGVDAKKAEDLFGHMETFGRYGFNKSHSAAYALVAYQTAFLKAHYPAAFMAATLSNLADNTDQIMKYMNSCRDMDIALLPPDVNRSREGFTLEDNAIRYGLSAIKNVGQSAVLAILEARNRAGEFKDLFQFCLEVDRNQLNRRVLENLVQAGAMDCFGVPKWDLFASIDKAMAQAVRAYEDQLRGQAALFGDEEDEAPPEYEKGQPWKKLECYNREKQSLGFYLTGHPLMEKKHILMRYVTHTLKEMGHLQEPLEVTIGGMVTHVRQRKSKSKGEMYAVVSLEDMEARAEALLFSETYSNYISKVAADRAVLVVGRAVPDGDKTKLIANAVVPLDDAAEELQPQTRGVLLKVPHRLCDEDWLLELFEKLRAHSGPVPVYMDVVDEGKAVTRLQLGSECQVSAGQGLLNDLDGFLGRDRVKYLFRPAGGERMESRA